MAKLKIGLDIGATAVRAVEIDYKGQTPALKRLGQVRLPYGVSSEGHIKDRQIVADAIAQLWEQQSFSVARVAIGVASQQVITRPLLLPEVAPNEIRANLPVYARDALPMPVSEATMDYQVIETVTSEAGNQINGLLVAVASDYIEELINVVELAGLTPTAIDLESFALARAFQAGLNQLDLAARTEGTMTTSDAVGAVVATDMRPFGHVLVHVGATLTLVVIVSDGLPRFSRIIMMGGQAITEAISNLGGVSIEQAERLKMEPTDPEGQYGRIIANNIQVFIDEIQNSLSFYRNTPNSVDVRNLVLSGGGALQIGLGDALANQLKINVVYGSALWLLDTTMANTDESTLSLADPFVPIAVGLTSAPVN